MSLLNFKLETINPNVDYGYVNVLDIYGTKEKTIDGTLRYFVKSRVSGWAEITQDTYNNINALDIFSGGGGGGGGLTISNFNNLSNGWSVSDGTNTFTHIDTGGTSETPNLQQVLNKGNTANHMSINLLDGGINLGSDSGNSELFLYGNEITQRIGTNYFTSNTSGWDIGHFDMANQGAKVTDIKVDFVNQGLKVSNPNYGNANTNINNGFVEIKEGDNTRATLSFGNLIFNDENGNELGSYNNTGCVLQYDTPQQVVMENGQLDLGSEALTNWKQTLGIADAQNTYPTAITHEIIANSKLRTTITQNDSTKTIVSNDITLPNGSSGNDTSIWTGHTNIDINTIAISFGDIASVKGVGYSDGQRLRIGDRVVANNGTFYVDAISEGASTYVLRSISGVNKDTNNALIQDDILGQLFIPRAIVGWGKYELPTDTHNRGDTFTISYDDGKAYFSNIIGNYNDMKNDGKSGWIATSGNGDLLVIKYDGTNYNVFLAMRSGS